LTQRQSGLDLLWSADRVREAAGDVKHTYPDQLCVCKCHRGQWPVMPFTAGDGSGRCPFGAVPEATAHERASTQHLQVRDNRESALAHSLINNIHSLIMRATPLGASKSTRHHQADRVREATAPNGRNGKYTCLITPQPITPLSVPAWSSSSTPHRTWRDC
jgi:hypothetical protein